MEKLGKLCFFIFVLLFSTLSSYASSSSTEENKEEIRLAFPSIITTPHELVKYGDDLIILASRDSHLHTLEIAQQEPVFAIQSMVTYSDFERYLFGRTFALCVAYKGLGLAESLSPDKAEKYFLSQIEAINIYLNKFGEFTSVVPQFNQRMQGHRYVLYVYQGEGYWELGSLHREKCLVNEKVQAYFKQVVNSYEKALSYGAAYERILINEGGNQDLHASSLITLLHNSLNFKFKIFNAYMTCIQFVSPKEQSELRQKANALMKEFKNSNDKALYKKAQETFGVLEKQAECVRLGRSKKGSKKVQLKRIEKATQLNAQAQLALAEIKKDCKIAPQPLKTQITEMHELVTSISEKNLYTSDESEINIIKILEESRKIEREIYQTFPSCSLMNADEKISFNNLKRVYEIYDNFLGKDRLIKFLPQLIAHFLRGADIEGALVRVQILKHLEEKKYGSYQIVTRYISAITNNLMGDHEEWLALEQEVAEKKEKLKEKKKKARLRKRQAQAALIKQQFAESKVVKKAQEEKCNVKEPIASTSQALIANDNLDERFKFPEYTQEDKLERQRRHEEAERQRNERKLQKGKEKAEDNTPEVVGKPIQERTTPTLPEKFSLIALYNLTGTPKDVDENIEQSIWNFTGEDLKLYYEAMGCSYKPGKGAHTKAALPKATHLIQDGHLITIMNDFGGALTLPKWEGKHVPYYLRRQILEARKKLAAHRLMTKEEVENKVGTSQ